MNIWVIGRSYPVKKNKMRGSFELEQAKLLSAHGHHVSYIAVIFHPINKVKKWGYCNFKDGNIDVYTDSVFYAPERMHLHIKFFQKKIWDYVLKRVSKEQGIPDIIHIHYPGMVCVPESVLSFQKEGTRIVTTDHWSKTLMNTMDLYQRKQLIKYSQMADAILCVGSPLKRAIQNITKTDKEIEVIPNLVSSLFDYKSLSTTSGRYNFIVVGRLEPVKQIDKIVMAFAEVFKSRDDIYLTVVGAGSEEKKIAQIVKEYNLESKVLLTGTLSRKDTAQKISESDALICYSQWETFGVPVIEAWACGKPTIGVESLGIAEYWNDDVGYIVKHDSLEELKQAMLKIFEKRNEFRADKISEFAINNFGEKAIYQKLMDVYRKLVEQQIIFK